MVLYEGVVFNWEVVDVVFGLCVLVVVGVYVYFVYCVGFLVGFGYSVFSLWCLKI